MSQHVPRTSPLMMQDTFHVIAYTEDYEARTIAGKLGMMDSWLFDGPTASPLQNAWDV